MIEHYDWHRKCSWVITVYRFKLQRARETLPNSKGKCKWPPSRYTNSGPYPVILGNSKLNLPWKKNLLNLLQQLYFVRYCFAILGIADLFFLSIIDIHWMIACDGGVKLLIGP